MAPPFNLKLIMEDEMENIEYSQQGFAFYKVKQYEELWRGYNTWFSSETTSHVPPIPRVTTLSDFITEIPVVAEAPTNTEEFILSRRAGRTVSNFIRNLMPQSITRGNR